MAPLVTAKRPDLVLINKKKKKKKKKREKLPSSGFCQSGAVQSENKIKRKDSQILGPSPRTKKAVEDEGESKSNCNWCVRNGPQEPVEETRRIRNQ